LAGMLFNTHRLIESIFMGRHTFKMAGTRHSTQHLSRSKVLPLGEWKRSLCRAPMQQCSPVSDL